MECGKAVIRGNYAILNVYVTEDKFKTNNFHLRALEF